MSDKRRRSDRRLRRAIFRPGLPPAYIEEIAGVFRVYVGPRFVGLTATERAALELVRKINGDSDGG